MNDDRIPSESARDETPEDAYRTAYDVVEGDRVEVVVDAESSGDIESCDDRRETWVGTVDEVGYDSRKNIHTIVGDFRRVGGSESGRGHVRHHTNKAAATSKGLTFGSDANGSRMWFDAPVDIFKDDRDRTVVGVTAK